MSTSKQGSIKDLTEKNFNENLIFRFNLVKKNKGTSFSQDEQGRNPMQKVFGKFDFPMVEEINYFEKDKTSKNYERYKKGGKRIIRYLVGYDSIFADEQSLPKDTSPELSYCNFVDGYKVVKGDDEHFLQYMTLSNHNSGNPHRTKDSKAVFYLYDKHAIVNKIIETKANLRKMIGWIYESEMIDLVMAYAMVLIPDFDGTFTSISKDEVLLRMEIMATADIAKFEKGMDNEAVLKKYYIKKAITAGKLELNEATNTLYWDSGIVLIQAPVGISPVDMFVDNTMTDASKRWEGEYLKVLSRIGKLREVEPAKHIIDDDFAVKGDEPKGSTEPIEPTEEDIVRWKAVIKIAAEKGVVTLVSPSTFHYMKDTPENKRTFTGYKGKKGIVTALVNDSAYAKELLQKVGEPVLA